MAAKRVRALNLRLHGYTAVADEVMRAIRGEAGKFGVYVAPCGAASVCLLKHADHNPQPVGHLVGVYTNSAALNDVEDALLARLREIAAARHPTT